MLGIVFNLLLIACEAQNFWENMTAYEQNCPKAFEPIFGDRILEVIKFLVPKDVQYKENLIRLGNSDDAGYFMLDDFSNVSAAYSMGIGIDWSWDLFIAKKGIPVYMFDPFVNRFLRSKDRKNPLLKFYNYGVASGKKIKQPVLNTPQFRNEKGMYTLEDLLNLDNNLDKDNMILKVDVEGWEWDFLPYISTSTLNKFSQIVIEFHWFEKMVRTNESFSDLLNSFKKLNETHQLIWVNGHNGCDYCVLGGVPFPNAVETTFVRREKNRVFKDYDEKKKHFDARNNKERGAQLLW